MASPTAFLLLPSRPSEGEDGIQATALALARSLEDLRLAERVQRALRATGYPSLRTVAVTVRDRLVTLQGRVPSYYMKQVAQAKALTVAGVSELCNELVVRSR